MTGVQPSRCPPSPQPPGSQINQTYSIPNVPAQSSIPATQLQLSGDGKFLEDDNFILFISITLPPSTGTGMDSVPHKYIPDITKFTFCLSSCFSKTFDKPLVMSMFLKVALYLNFVHCCSFLLLYRVQNITKWQH